MASRSAGQQTPAYEGVASTLVIANGGARAHSGPEARAAFTKLVAAKLPTAVVVFTTPDMDIAARISEAIAGGVTMVVASGGDGTINAVGSALAATGIVLGVLPHGTLNHFAKDLGIPLVTEDALELLRAPYITAVDVGVVNGRCFVNNSGLGLYPDMVAQRDAWQQAGASRWAAAFSSAIRALMRYHLFRIRVAVNDQLLLRRTPIVFVGNNEYLMDTPFEPRRATLNGGRLCLYIPHQNSRLKLLWFTLRALFGRLKADGEFDMILTEAFTIESRHSHLRVSIDGEVAVMATPLEYATRLGVLRVAVPIPNT